MCREVKSQYSKELSSGKWPRKLLGLYTEFTEFFPETHYINRNRVFNKVQEKETKATFLFEIFTTWRFIGSIIYDSGNAIISVYDKEIWTIYDIPLK